MLGAAAAATHCVWRLVVVFSLRLFPTMLLAIFLSSAQAATYQCTTEFGESVALRKTVLKAGQTCDQCAEAGTEIDENKIDTQLSRSWNKDVEDDSSLKTKIKRVRLFWKMREVYFDWRYAKRAGPSFKMSVDCREGSKCSGQFLETENPKLLRLTADLYDKRIVDGRGHAELNISDREVLDLRVRVFKQGKRDGQRFKVSASGEHMILELRPKIIHDVGVDEYLNIAKNLDHRIAALELKIRCELVSSPGN